MQTLRLPGVLIALGYLGIAAGTVAWLVSLNSSPNPWEGYLALVTPTVGYGLAGFACWQWILKCQAANADPGMQRSPSRWMAAASVGTAAGYAATTYTFYENHQQIPQHGIDPHYRLLMAGGLSLVVGLLLAGVGFWIASSAVRTTTEPVEAPVPVG